ncbi:MAG: dUTP diphosphatase [Patescibacteria group bacterium]
MNLKIKLVDKNLPKPEYQTLGSVGFDLYSRIDVVVKPWQPVIIPSNIIVKIPKGYFLMLSARSSTAKKFGLFLANGIGVIDPDYCGENDEIGVSVLNFTKKDVEIKKGDRIAQAILVNIAIPEKISLVSKMSSKNRGGFGSTGHRQKK